MGCLCSAARLCDEDEPAVRQTCCRDRRRHAADDAAAAAAPVVAALPAMIEALEALWAPADAAALRAHAAAAAWLRRPSPSPQPSSVPRSGCRLQASGRQWRIAPWAAVGRKAVSHSELALQPTG